LDDIAAGYDAIFCDVWGVLHNGLTPFDDAAAALARARAAGVTVVLVTNSPRPHLGVITQLDEIGVNRQAWDGIVTSGDVTRTLIANGPKAVLHVGAARDLSLYDGLDVELVPEADAQAVVCTGLYDDEAETPDDYAPLLARLHQRGLPFICANPDIVVERGDRLIWCAGALAQDFAALGGRTHIAGKPHTPIYDAATRKAEQLSGKSFSKPRILAIGDGLFTDIQGARDFGIDALFISGGIHMHEYSDGGVLDRAKMQAFVTKHGMTPVADMPRLA
jgi:HAD superfamily hydrolase (TIGR01459 family)